MRMCVLYDYIVVMSFLHVSRFKVRQDRTARADGGA